MYAIVAAGGKQYRLSPGMLLDVERLNGEVGSQVRLQNVLAIRTDTGLRIGHPLLKGAAVVVEVLKNLKGEKIVSFKYKRRKGYHRKVGHRQLLTRLKVVEIISNGA